MIPPKQCGFIVVLASLCGLIPGVQCVAPYEEQPIPPLEPDARLVDLSDFEQFDFTQATNCPDTTSTEAMIMRWDDGSYHLYLYKVLQGVNDWQCVICPDGGDVCDFDPRCPVVHEGQPQRRLSDTEVQRVLEVFSRVAVHAGQWHESFAVPCQVFTLRWYQNMDNDFWIYYPYTYIEEQKDVICESSLVEIQNLLNRLRFNPE